MARGIHSAVVTDQGPVRSGNEDAHAATWLPKAGGDVGLWVVCDGMGGAAAGEVASQTAIVTLEHHLAHTPFGLSVDDGAAALADAVRVADRVVYAKSLHERGLAGMGTTVTAALLVGTRVVVAQVGDSRAYVLRGGVLARLTRDQTLVQQLIEAGQLTEEEGRDAPFGNVVLQAVGTRGDVEVDLTSFEVARGDVLLLCSDGLHGAVLDGELTATLGTHEDPDAAARALVALAFARGAEDNVTCMVVRFDDASLPVEASPAGYRKHVFAIEADETPRADAPAPDEPVEAVAAASLDEPGDPPVASVPPTNTTALALVLVLAAAGVAVGSVLVAVFALR